MICSKCGETIPEGTLYCQKCGEDIHIVPDYDPTIEESLRENLNSVSANLPIKDKKMDSPKWKKKSLILGTAGVSLFVILLISIGIFLYRFHSLDYQLGRAASCMSVSDYEHAIYYLERALLLDSDNIMIKYKLSDVYYATDRKNDAINLLLEIAYEGNHNDAIETEDLLKTYGKLISMYEESHNYTAASKLVNQCTNKDVFSSFQDFSALSPGFSYEEGTYNMVVPLKLTSTVKGTIYYTMDGTVPDEQCESYVSPIFLETGEYTISAVFVNEFGVSSDIVTKTYVVEAMRPLDPVILTESGFYNKPTMILVDSLEGYDVFYSTDGTVPDENSNKYESPIPMPLGSSVYRFVIYDEMHAQSDILECYYSLELQTDLSSQDAIYHLMEALVVNGKIKDFYGNTDDPQKKYEYEFRYALTIPNVGDFYAVTEMVLDDNGNKNRTGSHYAIDIYDGTCYGLYFNKDTGFQIEDIQN